MSAVPVTAQQVRSKVAWVLQKESDALVVGLHAAGSWQGGAELDMGERRFVVVRADTVLEVREALADAEMLSRPTVVLTGLPQDELGHDVVARLARGKLFPVDVWEGVKALFKARQIDPSLRDRCLAEALMAHRPAGGEYPPVPAGVLDAATAWRAIFHGAFGLEDREPHLPGLLRWAALGPGAGRYLASPTELRDAARRRLAATLGPAAESILDIVEGGAARDALGLAVACEVVFPEGTDEPALQAAAARLERFHRNRPIPATVGRLLARAGRDAIDDVERDEPEEAQGQLLRADALLREVQAAPFAHLGRLTPLSWEGRLRRFARELTVATDPADAPALAACEEAAVYVADHANHRRQAHAYQFERTRMALRLARWLRTPEALEGSFARLAERYRDDDAWADRARDALAGGDDLAELSDA